MNRVQHIWSDDNIAMVRNLADKGDSSAEIAAKLSAATARRVTKNAVVGICTRRGIQLKNKSFAPAKPKREPQPRSYLAPKNTTPAPKGFVRVPTPVMSPEATLPITKFTPAKPSETSVSIYELNSDLCHWPLGDFADRPPYRYCGARVFAGPWCLCHFRQATENKETSHAQGTFKAEAA